MKKFSEILESFFKKIFPSRVLFEDGSFIEYYNREAILYGDTNNHTMEIVWDFNPKSIRGKILRRSDINYWDEPNRDEPLDMEAKRKIEDRIVEYCRIKKIPLDIVD